MCCAKCCTCQCHKNVSWTFTPNATTGGTWTNQTFTYTPLEGVPCGCQKEADDATEN